jgi:PIN domain nuclease of toxin-antitoxin system
VNLLLDTQLVLWSAFWPNKIPRQAAEAIKRASTVHISSVSVFEIALKASLGKLDIPFREFEVRLATSSGAERLSLTWEHACRSYDIATAHADPFDRLLLAQAIVEPLYLLSTDENLARYGGEFVMFVD